MKKIVVKIGGSLAIGSCGPRKSYFRKLVPVLKQLKDGNQLIVSIGGGKFIRNYFKSIEKLGLSDEQMEWIAIELLSVNVKFLSELLSLKPIYSLEEIGEKTSGVIGGIKPGRSTDANAAYAAAMIKADMFIKLTNVDGIYDSDPRKFRNAKRIERMSFADLKKFSTQGKPGSYGILDSLAIEIIAKNRISTIIMSGRNPGNILKAIDGKNLGTLVTDRI